jgi:hypothetical protein
MRKIKSWLDNKNCLLLNMSKTKIVPFSIVETSRPYNWQKVALHNDKCLEARMSMSCSCPDIEVVLQTTYLGVTLDSGLKWNKHVEALCKKLKRMLPFMLKLRSILDDSAKRTVYHALVRSIISYGIVSWGSTAGSNLNCVEILHKSIIKVLFRFRKLERTAAVYRSVKLLPVRKIYLMRLIQFSLANKHIIMPQSRTSLHTRYLVSQMGVPPKSRTKFGQGSVQCRGVAAYNALPSVVRQNILNSQTPRRTSTTLRQHFLTSA